MLKVWRSTRRVHRAGRCLTRRFNSQAGGRQHPTLLEDRHALSIWSRAPRAGMGPDAPGPRRSGCWRKRLPDRCDGSARVGPGRTDRGRRWDSTGALGASGSSDLASLEGAVTFGTSRSARSCWRTRCPAAPDPCRRRMQSAAVGKARALPPSGAAGIQPASPLLAWRRYVPSPSELDRPRRGGVSTLQRLGSSRGAGQRQAIRREPRREAERVIFVDTPSAILVDIDLRLRL